MTTDEAASFLAKCSNAVGDPGGRLRFEEVLERLRAIYRGGYLSDAQSCVHITQDEAFDMYVDLSEIRRRLRAVAINAQCTVTNLLGRFSSVYRAPDPERRPRRRVDRRAEVLRGLSDRAEDDGEGINWASVDELAEDGGDGFGGYISIA